MDTLRNLEADADSTLAGEPTSREMFLLEEGLELLSCYRAIGDPQVRLAIMQLVTVIAWDQTSER